MVKNMLLVFLLINFFTYSVICFEGIYNVREQDIRH